MFRPDLVSRFNRYLVQRISAMVKRRLAAGTIRSLADRAAALHLLETLRMRESERRE